MPRDQQIILVPGRRGLNLRDDPAALAPGELADSINWRIGLSSLEKRLGIAAVGTQPPAGPSLTVSGNEITDATRALAVDGDARPFRDLEVWGDYEASSAGSAVGWSALEAFNAAAQFDAVSSPVLVSGKAGKFTVRPGDQYSTTTGERCEVTRTSGYMTGDVDGLVDYCAFSVEPEGPWTHAASWEIFYQQHADARFNQAPMRLQTTDDRLSWEWRLRSGEYADATAAANAGASSTDLRWTMAAFEADVRWDVRYAIKWASDTSGWLVVEMKRSTETEWTRYVDETGIQTLPTIVGDPTPGTLYEKEGFYRNAEASITHVVYHDGLRHGHSWGDLDYDPVSALIDSSFGIWPAATNLHPNGNCTTNTVGWTARNSSTLTRVTSEHLFGSSCLQCVTNSGSSASSAELNIALTNGTTYTWSVWVKGAAGQRGRVNVVDGLGTSLGSTSFTCDGTWHRISVTFTATANNNHGLRMGNTASGSSLTFYIAGAQLEATAFRTPYIETDGATATRNAARVQAPSTGLDETQGWIAFRPRMGFASTARDAYLFLWGDDASNQLYLKWDQATASWVFNRVQGGGGSAASIASIFSRGDIPTIVAAWTATEVKISVNGSAFEPVSNGGIPTLAATVFDIGSGGTIVGGAELAGDVLWAAWGTGTLTDADAATIAAFDEVALTDDDSWQATADIAASWTADEATFDDSTAAILGLGRLVLSSGSSYLVAACSNGSVYKSSDNGETWASIASGLSTTAIPDFKQYLDKLYMANGVDDLQEWDGSGTMTAIAAAPLGEYLAVWQNRLYIGNSAERKVSWSAAGDPTDWTNVATNNVTFPDGGVLTGLAAAPNIGTEATSGDGVLVFSDRAFHRIYDDSDNVAGVTSGGANVLVDGSHGCMSHRSLAAVRGRVFFLGADGIYSTDGHAQARLESAKIGPIFQSFFSWANASSAIGIGHDNRYLFCFTPTSDNSNSRLLELYLDQPADDEGNYPWMAHEVYAASWVISPVAGQKDRVYFVDSRDRARGRIRWLFSGGSDVSGADTVSDFTARARTGGLDFGLQEFKRLRRLLVYGRGQLNVQIIPDFIDGNAETASFQLATADGSDPNWDGGTWDGGVWDAVAAHDAKPAYIRSVAGRFLTFVITETSSATTVSDPKLDLGTVSIPGAALNAMHATITPLDGP